MVDMLEAGCFQAIQDVQCFDLRQWNPALQSATRVTASHYASPTAKSSAASSLDISGAGSYAD